MRSPYNTGFETHPHFETDFGEHAEVRCDDDLHCEGRRLGLSWYNEAFPPGTDGS